MVVVITIVLLPLILTMITMSMVLIITILPLIILVMMEVMLLMTNDGDGDDDDDDDRDSDDELWQLYFLCFDRKNFHLTKCVLSLFVFSFQLQEISSSGSICYPQRTYYFRNAGWHALHFNFPYSMRRAS